MRTREGDDFIEKMVTVMSDYRLLHTKEVGNEPVGYPLIDALTFDGGTVDIGEEECGELAAELYDSVIAPFILEAERRAEQRVRAEIERDSERLDWLLAHAHYGIPGFDPVVSGRTPEKRRADLIRAIDAARENAND